LEIRKHGCEEVLGSSHLLKMLFIKFLSPVCRWFADSFRLYVVLAIYFSESRNFVWLFEHILLLVECIGNVCFVRDECIVSNREVSMFPFVGLCRPYIHVIRKIISATEGIADIARSFFSLALACQVVSCAFDSFRFEMAVIIYVPIYLTICTLSNIPFVFGGSNFILHCSICPIFNMPLLFGAGFTKKN
jgi:hypothetical protein